MKKSKLIFFNIILIFAICILNFFNINSKSYINNDLIIHYIDVGQGDCILIQVNNKNLLIDSGPSSNRDDLLNYLQKLNIDKFDYIIATHPHEDHIGNMDTIIKRFNVSNFYAPKIINTSISFENMISALVDKSLKVKVLKSGTNTINLGLNTKVEVFSPEENIASDNFNDYSSVIKISFLNTSFLFTGDAENFTEDYLISNNCNLKSDVLKVGHHGSSTSSSLKFLKAFNDKGNRSITLKPEGTAGAGRAFIESRLFNEAQPTKLYYITPCFRYENVQKGRFRQFHQFGTEVYGSKEPSMDAEVITLAIQVLKTLGLQSLSLNINNLGCSKCRPNYNEALKNYLKENFDNLCPLCQSRFEKNPMRILDCKERKCKEITKNAPIILDYMCEECDTHFDSVKKYLTALNIPFTVDPGIVRGLDYYTKTIFEILNDEFTVCGGGRYDKLIEQLGGPEMPAVGFGMGIERLIMILEKEGIEIPNEKLFDLYIGARGDNAKFEAFTLANKLREAGVKTEVNHMGRSVKAEMKYANKIGAAFTTILGDDELQNKLIKLKRMSDGEQFEVSLDNIQEIAKAIK